MKNYTPISMKCTQEQFEAIKPKLEKAGFEIVYITSFDNCAYLTNFFKRVKNRISNISEYCSEDFDRTVHCQWNEKVFLESFGEETVPTLEEVKEYFKDAKTVECLVRLEEENISKLHKKGIHHDNDSYWAEAIGVAGRYAEIWNPKQGYAKILTYKEPKFEITKEQILTIEADGINYMKQWFPEVFETVLEVGKWYNINTGQSKYLLLYSGDDTESFSGFMEGKWSNDWLCSKDRNQKYAIKATTEEVKEALKKEALKKYKIGDYVYIDERKTEIRQIDFNEFKYYPNNNEFYVGCDELRMFKAFDNGIWASVIPTKTKKEAEELLKELGHNFKIV